MSKQPSKLRNGISACYSVLIFLLIVGGLGALIWYVLWESPTLDVECRNPNSVRLGDEFEVLVTARNSRDREILLNSIQIDRSFLEGFQLVRTAPPFATSQNISMLAQRRLRYGISVKKDQEIRLTFKAIKSGRHFGDLYVSNGYEDFQATSLDIVVDDESVKASE